VLIKEDTTTATRNITITSVALTGRK